MMRFPFASRPALLLFAALAAACRQPPAPAPPSLAGTWRAVLASPGGELPFGLEIRDEGSRLQAFAVNGGERAPFSSVERKGNEVTLDFTWYDSTITATLDASGQKLTGSWSKRTEKGRSGLPFVAVRAATSDAAERFLPASRLGLPAGEAQQPGEAQPPSIAGSWAVEVHDEDGTTVAQAELTQNGERVQGTFLTPTGDYRYLDGRYEAGLLRLSTFDGAHAFLFSARVQADGTLAGDFWSRDAYHATWTGKPVASGVETLPDGWAEVQLTTKDSRLTFRETDLEGKPLVWDDPRFAGKVVIVNLFGSWCPNCNDEAPLLAAWAKQYRDRGLEVVGFAYEMTGDAARDSEMVRRYRTRHGIDYPLALVGVSDKQKAASTLPQLSAVKAFPTTIFIGRDGQVRRIHSGFAGPGTGAHFAELKKELEGLIESLLAEKPS